jgi:hypothetical protein
MSDGSGLRKSNGNAVSAAFSSKHMSGYQRTRSMYL